MIRKTIPTRIVSRSVRSPVLAASPKLASSRLRQWPLGRQHRNLTTEALATVRVICFRPSWLYYFTHYVLLQCGFVLHIAKSYWPARGLKRKAFQTTDIC